MTRKKRKKPATYTKREIKRVLKLWMNVWMKERDFKVDWYNFCWDLKFIEENRRRKNV